MNRVLPRPPRIRAVPARAIRAARGLASRRFALAWAFAGMYGVSAIVYTALTPRAQAVLVGWSSTNVHNLRTEPAGALVASAFIPGHPAVGWIPVIIVAMFTASAVLGSTRTALVAGAGHVIGTLVSEGILAARVADGSLPGSARFIVDVGPSYAVVSALAVAMFYAAWRYAAAAGACFAGMAGDLFGGLSHLDVSAVGHLTALSVGIVLGGLLVRRARPRPHHAPDRTVAARQPVVAGRAPARQLAGKR